LSIPRTERERRARTESANGERERLPADVGVTGFEIGVVGFSRSSIFLADGVLALLLVPLLGDGGGTSFFT